MTLSIQVSSLVQSKLLKETFDRFGGEMNISNVVYKIQNRHDVICDSNYRLLFKMISFLDVSEEVTINLEEAAALEEDNLDENEEDINC